MKPGPRVREKCMHPMGSLVRVHGLAKATQYNGCMGLVAADPPRERGSRIAVCLLEGASSGKMLGVRTANLIRLPPVTAQGGFSPPTPEAFAKAVLPRLPPPIGGDERGAGSGPSCAWIPPRDGIVSNVLVMLPGLGGKLAPFSQLAETMKLPQTACLSVRPFRALPMGLGYAWLESFERDGSPILPGPGETRRLVSLGDSARTLLVALRVLSATLELPVSRFLLLGFSQGAMLAVETALLAAELGLGRLAGVVAVSSSLLEEAVDRDRPAAKRGSLQSSSATLVAEGPDVFVTHGTRDSRVPIEQARKAFAALQRTAKRRYRECAVSFQEYKKGHEMISGKAEAKDLMAFFAKNLHLRNVALERDPSVVEVKAAVRP